MTWEGSTAAFRRGREWAVGKAEGNGRGTHLGFSLLSLHSSPASLDFSAPAEAAPQSCT